MYSSVETSDKISELLRTFWKADQFRTVGVSLNKIAYDVMVGVYEDYDCWLPYSVFIELFPILDERYVSAIRRKGEKGAN